MDDLAGRALAQLRQRNQTLAVAESLTGGRLAAALTAVPGASAVFLGGVVSYATTVKTALLRVPDHVVERHGVVSAECAVAMATGVRELLGSTWGVSTTGVAGPDHQEGHPAGTVFVGVSWPAGSLSEQLDLRGTREEIQRQTCRSALLLLLQRVA